MKETWKIFRNYYPGNDIWGTEIGILCSKWGFPLSMVIWRRIQYTYLSVLTPIGIEWASSAVMCVLRNWQRSPWSRYSITTHKGSSLQQAPRTLAMLRSSRAARILTSRWKSSLKTQIHRFYIQSVNLKLTRSFGRLINLPNAFLLRFSKNNFHYTFLSILRIDYTFFISISKNEEGGKKYPWKV